uniref:Monooxygenase, DBH-like 1, like n=1 Tax=Echeneis naucrates TaxID=173247 RepID=A0A665TQH7_ECHNA
GLTCLDIMRALPLFLCLFLARKKGVGASDPSMPFMVYLDRDHLVCLKWSFNNLQDNIVFKLVVNTTGWVGFGMSPNGGMKGSDIVVGGLGPSGSYFTDRYATGNSMPLMDEQQSYTLLSLTESDGQTIMKFKRSLQACDDKDFHITDRPIKLIYAYGTTDEIMYHQTRRGTMEVNLLNFMPRSSLPNRNYISATMNNITIPNLHTYYHCKVMKFPKLNTKHHIYQVEPVIENHGIVHHMILYSCPSYVTEAYDEKCFKGNTGDACFGVIAAWAIGGGVFELPENAGIPVGGEEKDLYYRLEIHYNNLNLEEGMTDSSGLRLHYTNQLRQHDVGILTTGVMPFKHVQYNIPPKAPEFHTYGMCNTSLFSQVYSSLLAYPVPDLQLFAVLLHTHLAGRKVRVGHYRNGQQIDFLSLNENYNFELQQIVNSGTIKTIKQGDEISVECTYNTLDRTGMGLATTDEMCLAFLFYYPAIKITSCISHPNIALTNSGQQQDPMYEFRLYYIAYIQEVNEYQNLLNRALHFQMIIDENVSNY